MKSILSIGLVAAGLCLSGLGAYGQDRDGYYRDIPYQNHEPLDHVRADLDRAASDIGYLSKNELHRFNKVRTQIAEFQNNWQSGRFNRHELDDVIGTLQSIVDRNRLEPRDRDLLAGDLRRLRDFRAGFHRW